MTITLIKFRLPKLGNCPTPVKNTFRESLKALQRAYERKLLNREEYLQGLEEVLKPYMDNCKVKRKPLVLIKFVESKKRMEKVRF